MRRAYAYGNYMSTAHKCEPHILDRPARSRQINAMTKNTAPPVAPAAFGLKVHDGLRPHVLAKGHSEAAADAMVDFDAAAFVFHRLAARGDMPRKLLAEMGQTLEILQFQSLAAILRIQSGKGQRPAQPATIGLLAEELHLDPSRASRIAADLIAAGYLRREAAQDDGRKSVLVLTDRAEDLFCSFRDLRFDKVMQVFNGWSDAEIIQFAALFSRYCARMKEVFHDGGAV